MHPMGSATTHGVFYQCHPYTPQRMPSERTERSHEVLLAAKDHWIKELEQENQRLKEDLKQALGKLYERL